MKNRILFLTILIAFSIISCKTSREAPVVPGKSTNNIKVPADFTWQNSRNVNFTVEVTDTSFQTAIFMIAIYDNDPANGGNLLAKGSATTIIPFKSKIYTSNQITEVYITKTSPDNSKTIQKVQVSKTDITTSIGI